MKLWEALKAFQEGEKVEYRTPLFLDKELWMPVNNVRNFSLNEIIEFRIKPEPKYRPYTETELLHIFRHNKEDFRLRHKLHDVTLFNKFYISNKEVGLIESYGTAFSSEDLLKCFTYLNGEPFGEEVQNENFSIDLHVLDNAGY